MPQMVGHYFGKVMHMVHMMHMVHNFLESRCFFPGVLHPQEFSRKVHHRRVSPPAIAVWSSSSSARSSSSIPVSRSRIFSPARFGFITSLVRSRVYFTSSPCGLEDRLSQENRRAQAPPHGRPDETWSSAVLRIHCVPAPS